VFRFSSVLFEPVLKGWSTLGFRAGMRLAERMQAIDAILAGHSSFKVQPGFSNRSLGIITCR
jgi:hypothetical protein